MTDRLDPPIVPTIGFPLRSQPKAQRASAGTPSLNLTRHSGRIRTMVGPLAVATLVATHGPKVWKGWKALEKLADGNTEAFKEARALVLIEWVGEFHDNYRAECARLNARIDDFEAKLEAREADHENERVFLNYAEESHREPTDERRRMLNHAAAGLANVTLSVAEHARVQRTLRELDGSDVIALYGLDRANGQIWEKQTLRSPAAVVNRLWQSTGSADILASAGCVRTSHQSGGFGGGSYDETIVTEPGRLLLRVLRSYCLSRDVPFEVPGREVVEGSRTEEEARDLISTLGGLSGELLRAGHGRYVRYDPPRRGTPEAVLHPKGRANLYIHGIPEDLGTRLAGIAPASGTPPQVGEPVEFVHLSLNKWATAECALLITGPHDILRWLADDLDARWR